MSRSSAKVMDEGSRMFIVAKKKKGGKKEKDEEFDLVMGAAGVDSGSMGVGAAHDYEGQLDGEVDLQPDGPIRLGVLDGTGERDHVGDLVHGGMAGRDLTVLGVPHREYRSRCSRPSRMFQPPRHSSGPRLGKLHKRRRGGGGEARVVPLDVAAGGLHRGVRVKWGRPKIVPWPPPAES